ncbi:hypothetical protein pb186bvf_002648 [Paramecium bursaria]
MISEQTKQQYLDSISKATIEFSNKIDVKEFLYNTILNKDYDRLIINNNDLNKDICKVMIYGHDLKRTNKALNILHAFIYFYIGSNVKIEELVDQSNDNPWDSYFNMCLYFIEGNQIKTKLYRTKFEQILKLSKKTILEENKQKIQNKFENLRNATQIIDKLIQIFQEDLSVTEKNKKIHFQQSYKFLKNHNMIKDMNDKAKDLKLNVMVAFLEQDYSFLKSLEMKDKNSLAIILYEHISVDYKQLSVFFSLCNDREKDDHIKQMKIKAQSDEKNYIKLVQVGRSLKKICEWDRTIDLYQELSQSETINQIQDCKVYLNFTICKIQFMKGYFKQAQKTCELALKQIDEFLQLKQLFYQPNLQRFLQLELLFLNLVIVYILREKESFTRLINYINFINQEYQKNKQKISKDKQEQQKINKDKLDNDNFTKLNGNLKVINQLFVEEVQNKDISKIKYKKQIYQEIIKFFGNKISKLKNAYKDANTDVKDIKLKTQCLLELFIMTEFVKLDKYYMVNYSNRDQLNLFLNMMRFKDLDIDLALQEKVFVQSMLIKQKEPIQIEDQNKQIYNQSDFQVRNDFEPLYKEIKFGLASHNYNLLPQIEKLLFYSCKYEKESQQLINGMRFEKKISNGLFSRVNQVIFDDKKYASKITKIKYNLKTQFIQNQQLELLDSRLNEINTLCYMQEYQIPYVIQIKHIGFQIKQLNDTGLQKLKIFYLSPKYERLSVILTESDQFKLQFAEKIALSLKQLQLKRITNFNLNPESLLVDDEKDPVIIFGSSISDSMAKQNESSILTQMFADPEIQKQGKKNRKSDVYSFGIILFYLFADKTPFDNPTQCNNSEFLSQKIYSDEVQKIKIREIQSLINNCVKSDPNKRKCLTQVLFQFLIMNPCRNDILKLLEMFIVEFPDIDITEEEYDLIKEFQKISLSLLLMNRLQIIQVQYLGEKLNKCQYQGNGLLVQKFQITTQNQQEAFRQLLQCMRFIRNVIHLYDKRVSDVVKFYNYQINIQENGLGKYIFFDIFWMDKKYHIDYLKYPQQLISLLRKIEEINKDGIFMMALDKQFLFEKNNIDTPVIFNFLYSQREQDDIQKNLYGWQIENQDNKYVQQTRLFDEVDLVKAFLRKVLNQFNEENDTSQLKQIVQELIDREKQFLTIKSMINHLTLNKIEIIQNSTNYSERPDINQFCQIVYQKFVTLDPELHDIIQKFLIATRRYKIESRELNNGIQIYKDIGYGGYGIVKKVNFQGKDYAQKISTISYIDIPQQSQIDLLKSRLNEINIICQIEDYKIPYILQNIHIGFVFKQEQDISRIEIYNLTPIYRPFSIIQESNDLKLKIKFAEKIAISLLQLQLRAISHQDIKPDNLLVDDKDNPVIIDFGISISNFQTSENNKQSFTLFYADPELVLNGKTGRKNDVYSFGITLYELFTSSEPTLEQGKFFLQIQTHKDNIKSIRIPEIQQLINKSAQPESKNRLSLCQVLFQFLMVNFCRRDVMDVLNLLMDQFNFIDITEQDYELIKEFQEISLLIPQMDSQEIKQDQQIFDNFYKCQYQDNSLLFNKYQIRIEDRQQAFSQLEQCMRFVRNQSKASQFYNYRLIINKDQSILFEIFFYVSNCQQGELASLKQVISLLKTIKQIQQNGNLALKHISHDLKLYFQQVYNYINRQTKISEQNHLFKEQLWKVILNYQDFYNIDKILETILIDEIKAAFQ